MLQAAIVGQAVALGQLVMVADDLAQGRLIAHSPIRLPASYRCWFVEPESVLDNPSMRTVREWLLAQFSSFAAVRDCVVGTRTVAPAPAARPAQISIPAAATAAKQRRR